MGTLDDDDGGAGRPRPLIATASLATTKALDEHADSFADCFKVRLTDAELEGRLDEDEPESLLDEDDELKGRLDDDDFPTWRLEPDGPSLEMVTWSVAPLPTDGMSSSSEAPTSSSTIHSSPP